MALGATWRDVVTMVMSRGLALAAVGAVLGGLIARVVTRMMQTLLYEVGAGDPQTYGIVLALIGTVAVAACAIPALRAANVDPMDVLRNQ
jgi:ABC-type antimicrobial peptide transport system permease subunit